MRVAREISTWSKDPSTRVGAVVVDERNRIVATGYNGFPRGVDDRPERYEDREVKYRMIVHAEANCILNAVAPLDGCAMVTMKAPCSECTKLIVQSGIAVVVYDEEPHDHWIEDAEYAATMFAETGVVVIKL